MGTAISKQQSKSVADIFADAITSVVSKQVASITPDAIASNIIQLHHATITGTVDWTQDAFSQVDMNAAISAINKADIQQQIMDALKQDAQANNSQLLALLNDQDDSTVLKMAQQIITNISNQQVSQCFTTAVANNTIEVEDLTVLKKGNLVMDQTATAKDTAQCVINIANNSDLVNNLQAAVDQKSSSTNQVSLVALLIIVIGVILLIVLIMLLSGGGKKDDKSGGGNLSSLVNLEAAKSLIEKDPELLAL